MTGREYIMENYIEELSYMEAARASRDELIKFFQINDNKLTMGNLLDCPIYPANEELYDQFCYELNGEMYFDSEDFTMYLIKNENHGASYRIDKKWEGHHKDIETYYLRPLTEDEKEELGL